MAPLQTVFSRGSLFSVYCRRTLTLVYIPNLRNRRHYRKRNQIIDLLKNSTTASRTPLAAWLGTPLSSSSSSLSPSTSPSSSSPQIMQMLWSTQHAMIVFGVLQWSASKHLSSALHVPFNKPNACSDTICSLESSLLNLFWSRFSAPLSLITGRSQVFNGYAESPTTRRQITVPPKSRVGSMRIYLFLAAQYTSLSRSIPESCRLLGNPVATERVPRRQQFLALNNCKNVSG